MHGSRRFLIIASVAAALSCGGSSDTTAGPSNPPANSTGVSIRDFAFAPSALSVKVGTTVRWTNSGPSAHTTTSDQGTWSSPTLAGPTAGGGGYGDTGSPGGTFDFTFTQPGTYPYHCSLHPPSSYPNFVGTITVTP